MVRRWPEAAWKKGSTARKVGGGGLGHQGSGVSLFSDVQRAEPLLQSPSLPASLASLCSGRGAHLSRLTCPSSPGEPARVLGLGLAPTKTSEGHAGLGGPPATPDKACSSRMGPGPQPHPHQGLL